MKLNPETWRDAKELFHAALEREPEERAAFLDRYCAGNNSLRQQVDFLLKNHEEAGNFLEQPIVADAAHRISVNQSASLFGRKLNHYQLLELLGAGGMGQVYLAQDLRLNRRVALKLLPALFASDEDRVRHLKQEARAISALNHPNIITIFEIGKSRGTHYIVTEHIEGMTLRQHPRMTLTKVLDVAVQIASALAAAHARGIVHRDIKPENVMVRADGLIKIVDFGLARHTEPPAPTLLDSTPAVPTATSLDMLGTIKYMSPEQAEGHTVDARSDIWSFGVLLYELLTGRLPFEGSTPREILIAIVQEQPQPLTSLPDELQQVVSRMLAKKSEQRYQTTEELLTDLSRIKQRLERETDKRSTRRKSRVKLALASGLAVLVVLLGARQWLHTRGEFIKSNQIARMSRLTTSGNVVAVAISPDGQQLVYVIEEAGRQTLRAQQVNNKAGSDRQLLAPEEIRYLSLTFSVDSKQVYYVTKQNERSEASLYRLPLAGGSPEKLPFRDVDSSVTFSPDGNKIAFISREVNGDQILKVAAAANGTNVESLATRRYPEFFKNPAWSPDGENIACVAGSYLDGFFMTLVNVRVKDGLEKPLTKLRWWSVRGLAWRSDGRELFLVAMDQAAGMPAYIARVDYLTGEVQKVTNDLNDYRELSLISSGKAFVAVQSTRTSDVWIAPVGDSARAKLITHTKYDEISGMAWTPSGSIVHALRRAGENWNIWNINPDGSNRVQLTDSAGNNLDPAVSPDGRYVVFDSTRAGTTNIWRMNIDGTNPKQLTSGPSEWWPSISLDGAWVIYTSFATGPPTLWKVPINGGSPVQLNDRFSILPVVAPAGDLLACYLWDGNSNFELKMTVLTIDGNQPVASFPSPSDKFQAFKWTSDGQSLAYIHQWEGTSNIWTRTIAGGAPRPITDFASDQIFDFALSHDGKQIAIVRGSVTNDAVLFELQ